MERIEKERDRRLRESVSLILVSIFFAQFVAVIIYGNYTASDVIISSDTFFIFLRAFSTFFILALVLYFAEKKEACAFRISKSLKLCELLYIGSSLIFAVMAVFLTGGAQSSLKFIFMAPVLVAALIKGRKGALYTFFIVAAAFIIGGILSVISSDILLLFLILSLGYALGEITDTETAYTKELSEMADRDGLTGLYNHRAFQERFHNYFKKAITNNEQLTLIMADIDDFKLYNESWGHQKGDQALAKVAGVFQNTLGSQGEVARYGGEEFVVILFGQGIDCGLKLCTKIQAALAEAFFQGSHFQPYGKLTVSFGIASYPDHADSPEELINHADDALYRAKLTTKNKAEVYSSILHPLYRTLSEEERVTLHSIKTLVRVVNAKDNYTLGHSERVANYAMKLAQEIGFPEKRTRLLAYGAYLHDIGKVEIDRNILNKKDGNLTSWEWETMKQHPLWGCQFIENIPFLRELLPIIKYHHENYDGSGYPYGLTGEEIPLEARIVRIVDSFDAMTSERPYGCRISPKEALEEILKNKGILYDPHLAETFAETVLRTDLFSQKDFAVVDNIQGSTRLP